MWATAPGVEGLWASNAGIEADAMTCPSYPLRLTSAGIGSRSSMLCGLRGLGFVLHGVVTQLESLILAQNERWRHA
jgi:hypothetical protein